MTTSGHVVTWFIQNCPDKLIFSEFKVWVLQNHFSSYIAGLTRFWGKSEGMLDVFQLSDTSNTFSRMV